MMVKYRNLLALSSLLIINTGCSRLVPSQIVRPEKIETQVSSSKSKQFLAGALEQTTYTHSYDPAYVAIAYPGGDVPRETGVCTDVTIRAFRKIGVDLQKEVHEDMKRNFAIYPQYWGLSGTDTNIDHRRVPNLMKYFERQGKAIAISKRKEDYLPGDVVTWNLGEGLEHIGIVTQFKSAQTGQFMIVHNIGGGARHEDVLFNWTIIGHYRYLSEHLDQKISNPG